MSRALPGDIAEVPLDRLHLRPGERFHFRAASSALVDSLARRGLASPPAVRTFEGRPLVLVTGRRRVEALRRLGAERIPVRRLGPLSTEEALFWSLEDNLHPPSLDEEDRPLVLAAFREAGLAPADLEARVAPHLGLPRGRAVLERHLALAGRMEDLRPAIEEGRVSVPQLLLFAADGPRVRAVLLDLLERYRPSLSHVRKLRELVFDILEARRTPPDRLAQALDPPPADVRLVLERLRALRLPGLHACEAAYDEALRAWRPPRGLWVRRPDLFEGDALGFAFSADSADAFRTMADLIAEAARRPSLDELFRRGLPHRDGRAGAAEEDPAR